MKNLLAQHFQRVARRLGVPSHREANYDIKKLIVQEDLEGLSNLCDLRKGEEPPIINLADTPIAEEMMDIALIFNKPKVVRFLRQRHVPFSLHHLEYLATSFATIPREHSEGRANILTQMIPFFRYITDENDRKHTLITYAMERGWAHFIYAALPLCSYLINEPETGNFFTPLHYAAQQGDLPLALLFVNYEARPNEVDYKNRTPLHIAIAQKDKDMVTLLVQNKTIVDDSHLETAFYARCKDEDVFRELLQAQGVEEPYINLFTGIITHNPLLITQSLPHITYKEGTIGNEKTAMHIAALYNNIHALALLIEHGYPVDKATRNGDTPLHYAAERNASLNCFEILLRANANPNVLNHQGHTPLSLLVNNGTPLGTLREKVNVLLDYGTNPLMGPEQKNPWFIAINSQQLKPILVDHFSKENPAVMKMIQKMIRGRVLSLKELAGDTVHRHPELHAEGLRTQMSASLRKELLQPFKTELKLEQLLWQNYENLRNHYRIESLTREPRR